MKGLYTSMLLGSVLKGSQEMDTIFIYTYTHSMYHLSEQHNTQRSYNAVRAVVRQGSV